MVRFISKSKITRIKDSFRFDLEKIVVKAGSFRSDNEKFRGSKVCFAFVSISKTLLVQCTLYGHGVKLAAGRRCKKGVMDVLA